MAYDTQPYAKLTRVEKNSIFLVLIGTFLEYFDLVLYVHLAVVLNPLFFPTEDPWMAGLLGVFTFSSAYLLRPVGAFIFGWMGDRVGRKTCIVWTAGLMGIAGVLIASLPSYASIGFTASVLFIFARALQGFSSIGEMVSAQVYVAEMGAKSRFVDFISMTPTVATWAGSLCALGTGLLCISLDPANGWRWAFFFGACVAFVGGVIRLKVVESPVFIEAQQRKKEPTAQEADTLFRMLALRENNYWCYFGMAMLYPLSFYFCMRYCSDLLKSQGLSSADVIAHNLGVSCIEFLSVLLYGWLTLRYQPVNILKGKLMIGLALLPFLIKGLTLFPGEGMLFVVQALTLSLLSCPTPAQYRILETFPVIGRCTNIGSAYATSHALSFVVTSVFVFFLDQTLGLWGVGALFMVTGALALFCTYRLIPAEKASHLSFKEEENFQEEEHTKGLQRYAVM